MIIDYHHLYRLGLYHFMSLALLLFCFVSVSAQQSKDSTALKKKIIQLNQQMENAFNANDMNKVAAFYSDDAEIVYSEDYIVRGRTNLDNYWLQLKDKGRGWKLTVVEIGGKDEFVYQLGKSDLIFINGGKETRAVTNFVLFWKKQADGNYKIFRDYLTKTKFEKE